MAIKRSTFVIVLSLLAVLGIVAWARFIYPQLIFSTLLIDRHQALKIADDYLEKRGVDARSFDQAAVFSFDSQTDQFLQSAIGFEGLKKYIRAHNLDMYFWIVRYYKENQKEEYRLTVSSKTGQVTSLKHVMEDSTERSFLEEGAARQKAFLFLEKNFPFDPKNYELTDHFTKVYDHRTEYTFAWQKMGANVAWSGEKNSGTGKLFISATVSGDEVTHFVKSFFSVPDQFNRRIAQEENTGMILSRVVRFFYILLFVGATFYLVSRRNDLAMHTTKKFYFVVAGVFFLLAVFSEINDFQYMLFNYRNTSSFKIYLWEYFSERIIGIFFAAITIALPSLSGELLHYQVNKDKPAGSFLHSIRSTFFSRNNAFCILLGYVVFLTMLGLQSILIKVGQDYLGVWVEHNWMARFSTAYLPFLVALTVGYRAAFTEEILYRLFAINWVKKIFKNEFLAVMLPSLVWGFAHTIYPVFPMWFRGLEMTTIGIFLSVVYLRFGLMTCIVGHYLFNVFWNSADYLFGQSNPFYFYTSMGILLLPFAFAMVCFALNQKDEERAMVWTLNKHQLHNLEILKTYLKINQDRFKDVDKETLKKDIASH